MGNLKMPQLNSITIAGNLTRNPSYRITNNNTPVINFSIASNRRYKDQTGQWREDVCYVGVVAWNKLADSCTRNLFKGSAVLVDGELQSRLWKSKDGQSRTVVEIKAHRIQFLDRERRKESDEIEDDTFDLESSNGEVKDFDNGSEADLATGQNDEHKTHNE